MKADYEHYKLHWEFFKSVNPKASELFFIDLQLKKLNETLENGLVNIDFSNDNTQTLEGYLNEQERQNFFFQKEYKEFLEAKLIELKTKENLRQLPPLENSIIVHYGCSDFNSNEHKVYWIGAINHTPNKTYFFENRNEVEVIEKFYKYVQDNKEKIFIHWSMNSPKFGFRAIENRYFEVTNIEIDLQPKNEIDLSEYLKNKYGINYIERQNGRLNNLAKLNGFSGIQSDVEVVNMNDATNRLELIFSIVQAEIQGNLKTNTALPPQQNDKPKPEQEQPETLGSIITHKEAETLVSGIKTQYKNIKGKRLKLLLIALQELELLPKERIAKKFHALCKNEFNWEIASYNAMNGYNFNRYTDTGEVEGMKQYIKTLLNIK